MGFSLKTPDSQLLQILYFGALSIFGPLKAPVCTERIEAALLH